jgi:hypothetical protein
MGSGVVGRARAKFLCEADDGDTRMRHHLVGGVVMVLTVLPCLEHRGKP